MERMENTVFISYRRRDESFALAVSQNLSSHGFDVFFDYESVSSGDFERIIIDNIRARAHFLLILSPGVLDQINQPRDWLRREIETAIDEKRNIIPLFIEGFNFGSPSVAEKLTGKLAELKRYNGLAIPSGYFDDAMERLRSRFLSIPLDTVLHPMPSEGWKMVKEEPAAANEVPRKRREETQEPARKARPSKTTQAAPKPEEPSAESESITSPLSDESYEVVDLKDLTTVSSTTAEGALDVQTLYKGKTVARTTIKPDGDTSVVLPVRKSETGEMQLDPFLAEQHEKNVQAAIASSGLKFEEAPIPAAISEAEPDPAAMAAAVEANLLNNNRSQPVFNDKAQGEDQLGIKDEVEALAQTLLLRDVEPPVAVGIMGGWGSGKSFVMYLISQYVQATRAQRVKKGWPDGDEKDPKIPAFVGHVYQIHFNAWTYAKSNLWASLMDTIFLNLNRQMQLERLLAYRTFSPDDAPPSREQIRDSLLLGGEDFKKIYADNLQIDKDEDLKPWRTNLIYWSQHLLKENLLWNVMRGQQVETLEKLKDTEEQLKQLKARREQFEKERPLDKVTARTLDGTGRQAYLQSLKSFMLAFLSDQLSAVAKDELKKQDVTEEEVQKYLEEARGLWGGFQTIVTALRRSKLYLFWTLIFFALMFALPYVWSTYTLDFVRLRVAQSISGFLTLLPTLTVILPWVKKSIEASVEAKKILEGAYITQQEKRAEEIANSTEKPLPQKISELQAEISNGSLAAYDALIGLLETQAEEQRQQIGPSARYSNLMEFVQARLDAATYENQLGLMHQVRQDIDELTYSLVDSTSPDVFPRGKPRVILYIDDLDRCPPTRVVEVLEAVQLLLNTKLFIVILGLDTRYVTRALEKEYKEILQHEGDPSGLDYIEKIIQIPYRVRPIEQTGLRNYLEKQMDVEKLVEQAAQTPAAVSPAPVQSNLAAPAPNQPAVQVGPPSNVSVPEGPAPDSAQAETPAPPPVTQPKAEEIALPEIDLPAAVIQFKPEDLDDLTVCCQKIALTPRSIKRLVNVFKLMKIFWFRSDKNAGLAERDHPRSVKQAVMCLLALSSAYPEVMREVFVHLETLYRQEQGQTELFTALNNIKLPPGSAHELAWQLQKYRGDLTVLKAITGNGQDRFAQITLQDFKLSSFNLVRSFSFIGDPVYWIDEAGEAEDSTRLNGRNAERVQARSKRRKNQPATPD